MRILVTILLSLSFSLVASASDKAELAKAAIEASCNSKNVIEAVECLHSGLTDEDHQKVISASFEELGMYHFGWGMGIRNSWGFWARSTPIAEHFNDLGIFHPDDMSAIIIESYWLHFNGCDIQLDEQIKYYQRFWSTYENKKNNDNSESEFSLVKDFIDCEV